MKILTPSSTIRLTSFLWFSGKYPPRAPGHGAVPGTGELVVMLPGPLGHQVGVVGGGGVGDGPGAPTVEVAEVVRQHLQLVSGELAVVPQNLIIMMVNINIKTDKLTRLTW